MRADEPPVIPGLKPGMTVEDIAAQNQQAMSKAAKKNAKRKEKKKQGQDGEGDDDEDVSQVSDQVQQISLAEQAEIDSLRAAAFPAGSIGRKAADSHPGASSSAAAAAAAESSTGEDLSDPAAQARHLRGLKKKLRQIVELEESLKRTPDAAPDANQLEKLSRRQAIEEEIALLEKQA
ncbi:hypothetical protein, variant [Capsaspora owczarzaki ATCC 30864]|nr:hypothetical protein, variant [Capsaspora owczarzaki ATCC 30864]